MNQAIATVWRIDIESDEFHVRRSQEPWHGFVAVAKMVESLRVRFAERSGHVVQPTWFLRLDPHIEYCFGRSDYVVQRYENLFDRLIAQNDPLGIHVHPYRWDAERKILFSDHTDAEWASIV